MSASYPAWGAVAGAALGCAAAYTPLGKKVKGVVSEATWNIARVSIPVVVGVMLLLPFEAAART